MTHCCTMLNTMSKSMCALAHCREPSSALLSHLSFILFVFHLVSPLSHFFFLLSLSCLQLAARGLSTWVAGWGQLIDWLSGRLGAVDWSQRKLRGARLQRVNLTGAVLRGADLREASMELADLTGTDLEVRAAERRVESRVGEVRAAETRVGEERGESERGERERRDDYLCRCLPAWCLIALRIGARVPAWRIHLSSTQCTMLRLL